MKKFVSVIALIVMVLSVSVAHADGITSNGVSFFKEYPQADGTTLSREISIIETGDVCASVLVSNTSSEEKNASVFFVTYKDSAKSEIKDICVKSVSVPAQSESYEIKTDVLKLDHNETTRAFLWSDSVTPVITPVVPVEKTERVFVDFEDDCHVVGSAPATNNSLPSRLSSSKATVTNDPEENGTRGKVVELSSAKGGHLQFNGFLNANVGISSLPSNYSATMEFDIFLPTAPTSTFYLELNPQDGGGAMKGRLAFTTSGDNARVVPYYSSNNTYDKDGDLYVPKDEFWGKWHNVKVEFSSADNTSLSETSIYFDGIEISRAIGVFGTSTPSAKRFSVAPVVSSTGGYQFYIDNVKISA